MRRFKIEKENDKAWKVVDTQAKLYNMPEQAVSLFLEQGAAIRICLILNEQWEGFVANPN